jgi:ESCRT-I complex subunit TSG101
MYGLVNDLSTLFNDDPPVYQKPASSSTTPTPPTNSDSPSTLTTSGSFRTTPTYNPSATSATPQQSSYTPPPSSFTSQPPQYGGVYNPYNQLPPTTSTPQSSFVPPPFIPSEKDKLSQKVKEKLQPHTKDLTEKINHDNDIQMKLVQRQNELNDQEAIIDKELPQLLREVNALKERESNLDRWVETHENKELDVDKMIEPEDAHSKQVLELLAEDNAIDDLVWVLGESLDKKTVDTESYLSRVRQLAREQFMKKALLLKLQYKL